MIRHRQCQDKSAVLAVNCDVPGGPPAQPLFQSIARPLLGPQDAVDEPTPLLDSLSSSTPGYPWRGIPQGTCRRIESVIVHCYRCPFRL